MPLQGYYAHARTPYSNEIPFSQARNGTWPAWLPKPLAQFTDSLPRQMRQCTAGMIASKPHAAPDNVFQPALT